MGVFERGPKEATWVEENGWAALVKFHDIEDARLLEEAVAFWAKQEIVSSMQ
jgi:hypothetical protein